MADKPQQSFAEYLRKSGGTSIVPPPLPKAGKIDFQMPEGTKGNPQDPLSWLIDIISRPLYSVTETVDSMLDAPEDSRKIRAKFDAGDTMGGIGESLATVGKVASAPVRGFFSQHKDDKKLTSQLIEKGTDVFGKEFNPEYEDKEDNVDPILKGVLGFVGDVAGDPLTWVPGAAIASIGKGIGRGAKAVSAGASAGAKTAAEAMKVTRTPVEEVLETAGARATPEAKVADNVDIPQSTAQVDPRADFTDGPYEVFLHNRSSSSVQKFATREEAEAFGEMLRKEHGWAPTTSGNTKQVGKYQIVPVKPATTATEAIVEKAPTSLGEAMRSSGKFEKAKTFLDELAITPPKGVAATADTVGGPDLSKLPGGALPERHEWVSGFIKEQPTKPVVMIPGGDTVPMVEAVRLYGLPTATPEYKKFISDQIDVMYEEWSQRMLAKLPRVKATKKKSKPEDLSTERARFRKAISTEDGIAQVEQVLGSGLTGYLKNENLGDPRFAATMDKLRAMLDDTGTLDDFDLEKVGSPFNKLLRQLGVDAPATVQRTHIDYRRTQSKVGSGTTPEGMVAAIREMGEDIELDAVTRQARADVEAVLPGVLERNLKDVGPEHGYNYVSDSGALRTDDIAGVGLGRYQFQVNTHTQMDILSALSKHISTRIDGPKVKGGGIDYKKGMGLAGPQRAKEFEKQHRAAYAEMVRLLDDYGVPIHVDEVFPNRQPAQFPLNYNEVYDTLAATSREAQEAMRMLMYNGKTAMPVSRLMETVARLLADEDIAVSMTAAGTRYAPESTEIKNFLAGNESWGVYGHRPLAQNQRNVNKWEPPVGARFVENRVKTGKEKGKVKGLHIEYSSTYLRETLAEALRVARPELEALVAKNKAIYNERFGAEVYDMTEEVLGSLLKLLEDPSKVGESLAALANVGRLVKESARNGQVLPQSAAATGAIVAAETAELAQGAKVAVEVAEASAKGGKKGASVGTAEGRAAQQKQFKAVQEENLAVEAAVRATQATDEVVTETLDVSLKHTGDINGHAMSVLDPLKKVFIARQGMEAKGLDLYRIKHSAGVYEKMYHGQKVQSLRNLQQKYGAPMPGMNQSPLVLAFQALQKGTRPVGQPHVIAAYDELAVHMGDLMGPGGTLGNVFFRNNVGVAYINDILGQYDILSAGKRGPNNTFFDIDEAEALVKETLKETGHEIDLLTAAERQWRNWPVDDPTDFLSKLHVAAIRMAADVGTASSFTNMVVREGLGSLTPQPGMVKLVASGKSRLVPLLDENLYVDKEVAVAFQRMDEVLRTSQSIDGEIGKFVHNVFDPVQNAWKVAITIYRPGHHPRNLVGDESMTFLAEGMKGQKKSMVDAFKVMGVRNDYEGVDIIKALNSLDIHDLPTSGTVISKGKYGDITTDGIVEAMRKEGVLPPAYVTEDVYIDADLGKATSFLKKAMATVTFKGKAPEKLASGVSEARDHYSRIKHFIQFIDKAQASGKYASRDEMLKAAGRQIMKWHPDVSLLSTTEHKYLRRLMPFYSWFRGAIPAIAGAAVINPGRVNAFNKASYNLAVATGVNPESLADPFPEDQLFPSFLTEQMEGPQFQMPDGSYVRVNPGLATWDVGAMMGGAPSWPEGIARGVAGSTSPLIRMPAEMLSGGSWGTGARINDMSDYLDAAIPGVNYLSNITGTSFTGSLAKGGLDPQFQHAKGNKDGDDQALSFLNYLSGLGIQDYSKPNYINFAEIEKRNREGEQRGF